MKTHIERDRGYLPHLEIRGAAYFITLRLADTLPTAFAPDTNGVIKIETES